VVVVRPRAIGVAELQEEVLAVLPSKHRALAIVLRDLEPRRVHIDARLLAQLSRGCCWNRLFRVDAAARQLVVYSFFLFICSEEKESMRGMNGEDECSLCHI